MKMLRFLFAFVITFVLVSPASAMTGNNNEPAHYLALGDSLAAGMLYDSSIGKGYSDALAEMLEQNGLLASYNKGFAVPGAQTTHLLTAIDSNISMPATGTNENQKIVDEIKKADIITLSIGANDVLKSVTFNADGTIKYNLQTVSATITKTGTNVGQILNKIKAINPSADVFVMGLYNPKPNLTSVKSQLNYLVSQVDSVLKKATEENAYYFVPVKETIASNFATYLPNPNNIHPNEAGYKAIAEQFYTPVKEYIGLTPLPEIIDYPTFSDVTTDSQAAVYVGKAAYYGFVKGYSDGTFKPYTQLKRVHVASILARLLKLPEGTTTTPYNDISGLAEKTQKEIAAAYKAGLLPNSKTFEPNKAISRLEVAQMIDKAYTYVNGQKYAPVKTAPFTDISSLTAEQKRTVTLLYDLGIATGSEGKFMPNGILTRVQAAKMMVELYEALQK